MKHIKEKVLKRVKEKELPEYEMPKGKAITEHRRLLKILKPLNREYKDQKSELTRIKKVK